MAIAAIEVPCIRFDYSPLKVERTVDGRLICSAYFARDGILEYKDSHGNIRREFRSPEVNAKAETLNSFKLLPVTIEHPPKMLDTDLYRQFAVGTTGSNTSYQSPFIQGEVCLFDTEAISQVENGILTEVSAGYAAKVVDEPGTWQGQRYDAVQQLVVGNHLALTRRGRAGPDVRLHLDSQEADAIASISFATTSISPNSPLFGGRRMATLRLDGVEYPDVPEVVASVVAPRLMQLEELKGKLDSANEILQERADEIESLQEQLDEATQERDRALGRQEGLETIVLNADSILKELQFQRHTDGNYYYVGDAKDEEEEYEEEEDSDEEEMPPAFLKKMKKGKGKTKSHEDEEEMPAFLKKKMKGKGKAKSSAHEDEDEEDEKTDSSYFDSLVNAWVEAEQMVPGIYAEKFDENLSPSDVQALVIQELNPRLDTSGRSPEYIAAMYDMMTAGRKPDGEDEHSTGLSYAIDSAGRGVGNTIEQLPDHYQAKMQAYKRPLGMTKGRRE